MADMGDHLKPFATESTFLDKQVGNWMLTVERNDLLPPNAHGGIGVRGDQLFQFAQPVWSPKEPSIDDLLCVNPTLLVSDGFDTQIGRFVLDGSGTWCRCRRRGASDQVQ